MERKNTTLLEGGEIMNKERLYYIDWLRAAVVLSLVPYHAALTYSGLGDIYIKTPVKDIQVIPFLLISAVVDNSFMTLLFFLSGAASYYTFQYKTGKEYIRGRVSKLLVPFILGTVLLCPMQAYFKGLNDGFKGSYLQFLPEFFSFKIVDYLGYAHLWFLLYLFIFSLICLPLLNKWRNNKDILYSITGFLSKGRNIYIPIIFIIIVETLLRPFFPGKQTFIMDWANVAVYLSVFIFGFVFAFDMKIQDRLDKLMKPSVIIIILCLSIIASIYYFWTVIQSESVYLNFLWAFTKGIYESFAIIFLVSAGKKYFNKTSSVLTYLSKASFPFYVMHLLPVSAFTYLFLKVSQLIYVKYLLVVVFSYAFLFVVYELGGRRIFGAARRGIGQFKVS